MKEIKEQVLEILQSKVKGHVKIERDYSCIGWDITIEHRDFNFSTFVFDEDVSGHIVYDIARYVLVRYKDEINSHYFK